MKKIIALILALLIFSNTLCFAEGESQTNTVYISENFNSYITGSEPNLVFGVVRAGDGGVSVVEEPDAVNKSVYLRGGSSSRVALEKEVNISSERLINLSFRFMAPQGASFKLPVISDSLGSNAVLLSLNEGSLYTQGEKLCDINSNTWIWAEIKLNISSGFYVVSIDGNDVGKTFSLDLLDMTNISFELKDSSEKLYLDDISLEEANLNPNREYYPSNLFLTDKYQDSVDIISMKSFNMFMNSRVAYKNGVRLLMPATPLELDGKMYVPLRFTAENIGAEVVWNADDNSTTLIFGGKTIKLIPDSTDVYIDSVRETLSEKVQIINSSTYIKAEDIGALLGQTINVSDGFVMIGDSFDAFKAADSTVQTELVRMVKYLRPTGEEMYQDLLEQNPDKEHPRLFARSSDFERLRNLNASGDEFITKSIARIKDLTDAYLDDGVVKHEPETKNAGFECYDTIIDKIPKLSFMYQLTGEEIYFQKAKAELINVASWPEWNPWSYLDTADAAAALAIGYDWLYDRLDDSDKLAIRSALINNALKVVLSIYRGDPKPDYARTYWISDPYNWNPHCNKGMLLACFAIAEDVTPIVLSDIIIPVMDYGVRSLEFTFDEWMPDGAWHEGHGYGNNTLISDIEMLSAFESALGTNYDFVNVPGITAGANFMHHMVGQNSAPFNFSDSYNVKNVANPYAFWIAKKLGAKYLAIERKELIENTYYSNVDMKELFWYDPAYVSGEIADDVNDKYFRKVEMATMRSSWDNDGFYAGIHSGLNGVNHSQHDTGTFIVDYGGVRWARELGVDGTLGSWYGGFGFATNYRDRAEGHNTLVMDETPYIEDDGSWPVAFSYDFDDQTIGNEPQGFTVKEQGLGENVATARVAESPTPENRDNKALRFWTPSADSTTNVYAQLEMTDPSIASGLEMSFKLKFIDEIPSNLHFLQVKDTRNETSSVLNIAAKKDAPGVGTLRSYNGGGDISNIGTINVDTWYDVKIIFDVKTQSYDIYLDDKLIADDFAVRNGLTDIDRIRIYSTAAINEFHLDDFELKMHPNDGVAALSARRRYDQTLSGYSKINRFESKPQGSLAITDMTPAYETWASSANRGIMLTDNRQAFVVRDEVKLKGKSDVYWFSHYDPVTSEGKGIEVTIASDGKSVIMHDKVSGNRMWVGIISDTAATFYDTDCTPLPYSPNNAEQTASLKAWRKLAIKAEGVTELNLTVAYIPLSPGENEPVSIPAATALSDWSIPDGELAGVDEITVNGEPIANFSPTKQQYNISIESGSAIPQIAARAENAEIKVIQADELPGKATVSVMAEGYIYNITINFNVHNVIKSYIQGHAVDENSILTSSIQEEGNPPPHTIDGNLETRWSAEGTGEWIIYDFKDNKEFSKLDLAWYRGAARKYRFQIQFSTDAVNWTTVFDGESSGTTGDCETYSFDTLSARYLRIICNGSNENLWNNIAEVR